MKFHPVFLSFTFCMLFLSACEPEGQSAPSMQVSLGIVPNSDCLSSYELNEGGSPDTINKQYGKEKVKEGYWILYEMETGADTDKNTRGAERPTLRRIRAAEGYYQKNLRQGWWIFYKKDGTLRDSVYYHQDTIRSKSINFF